MRTSFSLSLLFLCLHFASADVLEFSVDPASPAISPNPPGANLTPDDVLVPGPYVAIQGTSLGLIDNFFAGGSDNLNAWSYGTDPIQGPIFFSVNRTAVGLPGTAVFNRAQPGVESAAGDIYFALPPFNNNQLWRTGGSLGLTEGFFGDDLDALTLMSGPNRFFTIDRLSVQNGSGTLNYANDIFINGFNALNPFARGETHIGLNVRDSLDALVLLDVGRPGILDPGQDMALFSIDQFSPNALTAGGAYSPGDILFTDFTGGFTRWASAADLGLRPDDELNALATIPEPGTVALLVCGVATLFVLRRRLVNYKST